MSQQMHDSDQAHGSSGGAGSAGDRVAELEARIAALEAQVAQAIQTQSLRLVDSAGVERALVRADPDGPSLVFLDDAGAVRLKVALSASGPGLTLADDMGHTRAWLGFTKEALRIGFADENGNSRAFFGVMRSGQPVAKFYDCLLYTSCGICTPARSTAIRFCGFVPVLRYQLSSN